MAIVDPYDAGSGVVSGGIVDPFESSAETKPTQQLPEDFVQPSAEQSGVVPGGAAIGADLQASIQQPPVQEQAPQNDISGILAQYKAGTLDPKKKAAIEELQRRGKINLGGPETPGEMPAPEIWGGATESDTGMPLSKALKEGAKAFPSSVKKQMTSLIEAVTSPAKTWEGVKALSKDIYKNQMEVALKDMGFDPAEIKFKENSILDHIEQTPALDFVIEDLNKTYGSYEGFKNAIATDPARVITDMATIAAPAAKGVEVAAIASKLPGVAKVAGAVSKGAALSEPITAAVAGTKQAVSTISKLTGKAFDSLTPTGLYKSATKMSTVLSEAERTSLANVALEAGIMPTIKGLEKIDDKIATIDNTIAEMIDSANLTGKTMPLGRLFKEFKNLKTERLLSTTGARDVKAIDRIRKNMLQANAKIKRGRLSPEEVQKLKQTIYKDISGHYEKIKNSTANIKTQKSVARAAKNYLEELLPEIKGLNKKDSDLINLRKALDRPVSRIANRDIIGLGMASKAGGGGVVGGMIGGPEIAAVSAGAGVVLGILDDPIVKSKIAIILDKLQKQGVKIPEDRAIKRLLAEQALTKTPAATEGEK